MPCQVQGRTLCAVLADGLEEVLPVCTAGVDYGTCMPSVRDDRLQFGLDRENDRTAGALVAGHLTFSAAGFCFAAGFVAFFAFAQRAATAFFGVSFWRRAFPPLRPSATAAGSFFTVAMLSSPPLHYTKCLFIDNNVIVTDDA
jgi:hypothetical protein